MGFLLLGWMEAEKGASSLSRSVACQPAARPGGRPNRPRRPVFGDRRRRQLAEVDHAPDAVGGYVER